MIPSDKGSSKQEILLTHEGKKLLKEDVAHHINDYFVNIGRDNSGNSCYRKVAEPNQSAPANTNIWSFEEIANAEVLKIVQSINISKSSGLNNISSFVIKEVFQILISQITYLFNLTLRTAIFPDAWKEALVIPIPKTGDLTNVKNYRPISLLPLPGKLLEKLE